MNAHSNALPKRLRLRVDDYLLLHDAGALAAAERTELIDGEICILHPRFRPEAMARMTIAAAIGEALRQIGSSLEVLAGVTVAMPSHDCPQVDIAVFSTVSGDGPLPLASIALIVEVADAQVAYDLHVKAEVYAVHAVPEYWVVDVAAARVVRMCEPVAGRFCRIDQFAFGDIVVSVTIQGLAITTAGLSGTSAVD